MSSLEFLLGLLDSTDPTSVGWEELRGPHAQSLLLWQDMGFLDREPGRNPVPGCPYCGEGVPYIIGGDRCLCNCCFSTVDRRYLLRWGFNREAFLRWLAAQLRVRGEVRPVDDCL